VLVEWCASSHVLPILRMEASIGASWVFETVFHDGLSLVCIACKTQDTCVSKCKALMEEEIAATGSANAMTHQYALDHREVVAKFGRCVVS